MKTMSRTEYMRHYRIRYGITKSVNIPVDVLAKALQDERSRNPFGPLSVHLGEDITGAILEAYDDER